MAISVRIPTVLRNLTENQDKISVEASSIDEMLAALESKHAGIKAKLCDDDGKLRRFVNIFVGEDDIRFLDGQETSLKDGDDIDIVPAIAGGK
ncbi:MAG: MoaD/ThiS family protein [Planctomycetes bacterium]|nr:MoaD/ThiS family protein [Planctomycetota bacterium]